jgi:hypothetical protein
MKNLTYVYDPRLSMLAVFENDRPLGGYMGRIAERKLESLLNTDAVIHLGQFLTRKEIEQRNLKTR